MVEGSFSKIERVMKQDLSRRREDFGREKMKQRPDWASQRSIRWMSIETSVREGRRLTFVEVVLNWGSTEDKTHLGADSLKFFTDIEQWILDLMAGCA